MAQLDSHPPTQRSDERDGRRSFSIPALIASGNRFSTAQADASALIAKLHDVKEHPLRITLNSQGLTSANMHFIMHSC